MSLFIKTGFWEKSKLGYKDWLNLDEYILSIISSVGGIRYNKFVAIEGQTTFVTDFTPNDKYIAFIDDVKQSGNVVSRNGDTFTTPPLSEGQILEIYD